MAPTETSPVLDGEGAHETTVAQVHVFIRADCNNAHGDFVALHAFERLSDLRPTERLCAVMCTASLTERTRNPRVKRSASRRSTSRRAPNTLMPGGYICHMMEANGRADVTKC